MVIRVPESAGTLYECIQYPAGELQVRLTASAISALYSRTKISVICRAAHLHLMELALLSDALHGLCAGIDSTLILPYLPYGRADRRFQEGDCHGLKTFGRMLDWGIGGYSRVRTLDVHSFRAQKNVGNLENVSARSFISRAMNEIADKTGHLPAILLPDEGAKRYGFSDVVQCSKRRDPSTGKLSGFEVPDFYRRDALIVDDICDGGGTFIGLAEAVGKRNCCCKALSRERPHPMSPACPGSEPAKRLYLYVTHGIFSKGFQELFRYFEKIYTTNSLYPSPYLGGQRRVEVYNCEPELLGEAK